MLASKIRESLFLFLPSFGCNCLWCGGWHYPVSSIEGNLSVA